MTSASAASSSPRRLALLVPLSALLGWGLHQASFPAAALIGPMLAAVCLGLADLGPRLPSWTFLAAQALVGCLVARSLTPDTLAVMVHDWPVMLASVAYTVAAGAGVGFWLQGRRVLPGDTAAWGCSPGGAAAMTAMAQEWGADVRLVAFMQYLRVFLVVLTASAVSRLVFGVEAVPALGQAAAAGSLTTGPGGGEAAAGLAAGPLIAEGALAANLAASQGVGQAAGGGGLPLWGRLAAYGVPTPEGLAVLLQGAGFDVPALSLLQTLALAAAGTLIGPALRLPAGAMLLPMAAGAVLNASGAMALVVPPWLSALAYALLGWHIGLRFTPRALRHALRALPWLLAATAMLMGLCALSAWLLTLYPGLDGLTAYLATSPGGLDSVAAIAVGSRADVPFVLALQSLRLFAVVAVGPLLARLLCRHGSGRA